MVVTTSPTTTSKAAVTTAFEPPSAASTSVIAAPQCNSNRRVTRTSAQRGRNAQAMVRSQPHGNHRWSLWPLASAAATPPAKRSALPDADSQDEDLQRKLVLQGQQMLTQGHVASARLLFRRAADTGSAEAAILLGDTFDPQSLVCAGSSRGRGRSPAIHPVVREGRRVRRRGRQGTADGDRWALVFRLRHLIPAAAHPESNVGAKGTLASQ